jgi:hypothetical protein
MNKLFYLLVPVFLIISLPCIAQENAPIEKPVPFLIVQTGIGIQWFGTSYKLSTYTIEKPLNRYWRLGLQGTMYFKKHFNPFSGNEFLDGYEIGPFAQYFLHRQNSGRMSRFFIGPEIRIGIRKFQMESYGDFFPLPPTPVITPYQQHTTKFLLRVGMQWQFGHATLELAVPVGYECSKTLLSGVISSSTNKLMMLPTIQMGLAF